MYSLEIKIGADKVFKKLSREHLTKIFKKIQQIQTSPKKRYKFLRKPLHQFNRVHIARSFVLIFQVNHEEQKIIIYYYGHHDLVYNWRQ